MNKEQAADFLGCSVRALERYTQQGKLSATYVKGKTRPTVEYDEEELRSFKSELNGKLFPKRPAVEPPGKENLANPAHALARFGGIPELGDARQMVAAIVKESVAAALEARPDIAPAAVPVFEKLTLSLMEASQLSGLSRNHLRQAIEEKKLKARIIGRGWRVKREDLDAYVKKL